MASNDLALIALIILYSQIQADYVRGAQTF